jgi:hypothetical protein
MKLKPETLGVNPGNVVFITGVNYSLYNAFLS